MSPNDADRMANSVDPDQTAPLGAVWSGSALFAQACLSENLGSLRYIHNKHILKSPSNDSLNMEDAYTFYNRDLCSSKAW